jgi:uncharacterized membrane protein
MGISTLIFVFFWAVVFGFIIWLVLKLTRQHAPRVDQKKSPPAETPVRYARGETDKAQYEQPEKDLVRR